MNRHDIQKTNPPLKINLLGHCVWAKGDQVRVYFDLEANQDVPVNAFYEVIQGSSNDKLLKRGSRVFAIEPKTHQGDSRFHAELMGSLEELATYLSSQDCYPGQSTWKTEL